MLKYKNIVTILSVIILSVLPSICLADIDTYNANKYLPASDVSLKLLSDIFGAIPGISHFVLAKKTVFSTLFYTFNWGLLGISGVFLCYTTIKLITDLTLEGGQMKGNISSMWTVLRTIGGIGLLIPTSNGYSTANTLVMWVVIQSIALANWTWNNVLNYGLTDQVGIVSEAAINKQTEDKIAKTINHSLGGGVTDVGAADILRSLACAETIKYALSQVKNVGVSPTGSLQTYFCQSKAGAAGDILTCSFPYIPGLESQSAQARPLLDVLFPGNTTAKEESFKNFIKDFKASDLNGICGVYYGPASALQQTVDALSSESKRLLSVATSKNSDAINPVKYVLRNDGSKDITMATSKLVADGIETLTPANESTYATAYKTYKDDPVQWGIEQSLKIPQTAIDLLSAAITYNQNSAPQALAEQATISANNNKAAIEQLNLGWVMAGGYYRDIGKQIEQTAAAISTSQIQYDGKNKASEEPRSNPPIDTLFIYSGNAKSGNNNVALLLRSIDELGSQIKSPDNAQVTDSNSNKYLAKILKWIYYTTNYAAILKYNLQTQDSDTGKFEFLKSTKDKFTPINTDVIGTDMANAMAVASIPLVNLGAYPMYAPLPTKIAEMRLGLIVQAWHTIMSNEGKVNINGKKGIAAKDPISKLQLLGHAMIHNSLAYFNDMKKLLTDMGVAYSISSGISAGVATGLSIGTTFSITTGGVAVATYTGMVADAVEKMVQAMVSTEMAMGLAIFAPLMAIGITLSVYIPFIPYMLFLFGVISWLIAVITLMFAAPMICFLMLWGAASQENPLLSREAEAFVNQLISAFVRPILMIAGLVAGVVLCNVGVDLLNRGFELALKNNLFDMGADGIKITADQEKTLALAKSVGAMAIYTFILISIVNMGFSAIHVVYTEVMRLVGIQVGAVTGAEAEKAMQEVKQGTDSLAQASAGGMKEQATGMRGSSNKAQEKDMSKIKIDKEKTSGVNTKNIG